MPSVIDCSVMMQRLISGRLGTSNMLWSSTSSMIDLSPRAPVPRSRARLAIAFSAPSWKTSSTSSSAKIFSYYLTKAFFSSVRMRMMSSSSR